MKHKKLAMALGAAAGAAVGAAGVASIVATRQRRAASRRRTRAVPATFSGDMGGGGVSVGADLGRGGASTPTGDLAGGGQPGSLMDVGGGTVTDRDAVPTGGGVMPRGNAFGRGENSGLPEPVQNPRRTSTDMAPGIPAGSGRGIDKALQQPDSDLGGGVAGDTTARTGGESPREPSVVREDDKRRTTL